MISEDLSDAALQRRAAAVIDSLAARALRLVLAESCTGGWIAKVLTDTPGSSAVLDRALVVYANDAKSDLLGVNSAMLARHGAVSAETVGAMAAGARAMAGNAVGVAVSGIAGPGGGSTAKPVGTVWIAWAWPGREVGAREFHFPGDRDAVRRAAVAAALDGLIGS